MSLLDTPSSSTSSDTDTERVGMPPKFGAVPTPKRAAPVPVRVAKPIPPPPPVPVAAPAVAAPAVAVTSGVPSAAAVAPATSGSGVPDAGAGPSSPPAVALPKPEAAAGLSSPPPPVAPAVAPPKSEAAAKPPLAPVPLPPFFAPPPPPAPDAAGLEGAIYEGFPPGFGGVALPPGHIGGAADEGALPPPEPWVPWEPFDLAVTLIPALSEKAEAVEAARLPPPPTPPPPATAPPAAPSMRSAVEVCGEAPLDITSPTERACIPYETTTMQPFVASWDYYNYYYGWIQVSVDALSKLTVSVLFNEIVSQTKFYAEAAARLRTKHLYRCGETVAFFLLHRVIRELFRRTPKSNWLATQETLRLMQESNFKERRKEDTEDYPTVYLFSLSRAPQELSKNAFMNALKLRQNWQLYSRLKKVDLAQMVHNVQLLKNTVPVDAAQVALAEHLCVLRGACASGTA